MHLRRASECEDSIRRRWDEFSNSIRRNSFFFHGCSCLKRFHSAKSPIQGYNFVEWKGAIFKREKTWRAAYFSDESSSFYNTYVSNLFASLINKNTQRLFVKSISDFLFSFSFKFIRITAFDDSFWKYLS